MLSGQNRDVVEKVSASLKRGGHRSARQYFSQARRQHVLHTGKQVPADVELCVRDMTRSLERGLGGPALKDAFRLESLELPRPEEDVPVSARTQTTVVVLGCWFLLREIEVAALKVKYFVVDEKSQTVSLTLQSAGCTLGHEVGSVSVERPYSALDLDTAFIAVHASVWRECHCSPESGLPRFLQGPCSCFIPTLPPGDDCSATSAGC